MLTEQIWMEADVFAAVHLLNEPRAGKEHVHSKEFCRLSTVSCS